MTLPRVVSWTLLLATLGTAPALRAQGLAEDIDSLPAAGLGRLTQDQISITLQQGDLQIRFLPLNRGLLRLLAPDGYASMRSILQSRQTAIDSAAQRAGITRPGVVLVTFFGQRDNVTFQPQDLYLDQRNQIFRPVAIIPYSPGFTAHQLQARGQATAIYVFELPVPVFEGFQVGYGATVSNAWSDAMPTIARERDRVVSRWRQQRTDSGPTSR